MGDTTFGFEDCPKCGGKRTVEGGDQPSAMSYGAMCMKCGYRATDLDYYETGTNEITLMTEKQYKEWKKKNNPKTKYQNLLVELGGMIESGSIVTGALGLSQDSVEFVFDELNKCKNK